MQAITTKIFPATDKTPSRVRAKCAALGKYFEWDDSLAPEQNHRLAAKKLASILHWDMVMASGANYDGTYSHVFLHDTEPERYKNGPTYIRKYRPREVERVRNSVLESDEQPFARVQFSSDKKDSRTLNVSPMEMAAFIALFNQYDND